MLPCSLNLESCVSSEHPPQYFGQYISLLSDFGFKRIFGDENQPEFLLDFLQQLLPHLSITSIRHLPTIREREKLNDRVAIFDLHCTLSGGEHVIIELQKVQQKNFIDRSIFYSSFAINSQGIRGQWDYSLKGIYTISILDFAFEEDKRVIKRLKLMDTVTKDFAYDKLEYLYIQLPNFTKSISEVCGPMDMWLFTLRHLHLLNEQPIPSWFQQREVLMNILSKSELANLSPQDQIQYYKRLHWIHDREQEKEQARQEGQQQGLEQGLQKGRLEGQQQGIEKGLQKGRLEGREEGLEQGLQEGQSQVVRNMTKAGFTIEQIHLATNLSIEEIQDIQRIHKAAE